MAKLIYGAMMSLDGYINDKDGKFDWAEPDEEVHAFINDIERVVGTYLYGRRMYETMVGWETDPALAQQSPVMQHQIGILRHENEDSGTAFAAVAAGFFGEENRKA